jgi:hypothetical protein
MPLKKCIILFSAAIVLAILACIAMAMIHAARNAAQRSMDKGRLNMAWLIVVGYKDEGYTVPASITTVELPNGKLLYHSWRAIAMIDSVAHQTGFDGMKDYQLNNAWNSIENLEVADRVETSGYNYFGLTRIRFHDHTDDARILAVIGDGGAWLKNESQTKEEFINQENKIAFVLHPNPGIELFEPRDITVPELIDLVVQHGEIHAYSADRRFLILDQEWVESNR